MVSKQRDLLTAQVKLMLGDFTKFNGYAEFCAQGAVLDGLEEHFHIVGERYLINEPGNTSSGLKGIVQRGQVSGAGSSHVMNDYRFNISDVSGGSWLGDIRTCITALKTIVTRLSKV